MINSWNRNIHNTITGFYNEIRETIDDFYAKTKYAGKENVKITYMKNNNEKKAGTAFRVTTAHKINQADFLHSGIMVPLMIEIEKKKNSFDLRMTFKSHFPPNGLI